MDGRCNDCRWWDRSDPEEYAPVPDLPDGVLPEEAEPDLRWGVCRLTVYGRGPGRAMYGYAHPESKALARDAEEYSAMLLTLPDFGCTQFQPKDG